MNFFKNERGETGNLVNIVIGLTIFMIVLAYLLAPVGLTAFGTVNRTAAGVASGTTGGNIWDAIVPIVLAVLILALVLVIKKESQ